MLSLGPLAFLNPWLLAALPTLPALWLLLRVLPPSPRRVAFAATPLLLGLSDRARQPDRTPWPILLLRVLAAACVILAFAEPVLNPRAGFAGRGPLLLALDGGWASAPDWARRKARAAAALDRAERAGRGAVMLNLARLPAEPAALNPRPAPELRGEIARLAPAPWPPQRAAAARLLRAARPEVSEILWLQDGLDHDAASPPQDDLTQLLAGMGPLTVIRPARPAPALTAPGLRADALRAEVLRADPGLPRELPVSAWAPGPDGGLRRAGSTLAAFKPDQSSATAAFALPLELRNRIALLRLEPAASAGATALTDESVRRRRVALIAGDAATAQRLTSGPHYLRAALAGRAELVEAPLSEALETRPDAIILADIGAVSGAERAALERWMEAGGLLLRFAGPHMARAAAGNSGENDPLLPYPLRAGGRDVSGAMSWGAPQRIAPFPPGSPFAGLIPPAEAAVSRQLLARPGPDLGAHVWAALEDGTPLVTAAARGAGRVALFHVSANAEWSSLPLSGLFMRMMERLLLLAGGGASRDAAALEGAQARAEALLDGFGALNPAEGAAPIPAERLRARPGPDAPPGIYRVGEARLAFNLFAPGDALTAAPPPPAGVRLEAMDRAQERPLGRWLLTAAFLGLVLDAALALFYAGKLGPIRRAALPLALCAAFLPAPRSHAQDAQAVDHAGRTTLAYVLTGDARRDALTEAGLSGLSRALTARSAVEPGAPAGVNPETDELAFYPLLYWRIAPGRPPPSDDAIARLNAFMRAGGVLIIDTADRHQDVGTGATPGTALLRRLAGRLDLPPLEPIPPEHVLTRSFYLLTAFPGRHSGGRVWVEADAGGDGAANDGVSPVIVGDADWAAAWATDARGRPLAPVSGPDGPRQRELALRFGINAAMYALTGNYKADQVHVPALLERLGQ